MSDDQQDVQEVTEPTPIRPTVQPSAPTVIVLAPQDLLALSHRQYHAEWLASEVARIEAELAYVRRAAQGLQQEMLTYVSTHYGVAGGLLDLERGLLHVVPGMPGTAQGMSGMSGMSGQNASGNSQPEHGA